MGDAQNTLLLRGVVILDRAFGRFYDTKFQNINGFLYHQTIGI
jgi:hypothetical protein